MSKQEKRLTKFIDLYNQFASLDHHKDCDMHFYIKQEWNYTEEPVWVAYHQGYLHDFEMDCSTYEDAATALTEFIIESLEEDLEEISPEDYDPETYRTACEIKRKFQRLMGGSRS